MRHGKSEANERSIIVSDPAVGTRSFGLSETGREQVRATLVNLPDGLNAQCKIISSDFLRARETAAIIATGLNLVGSVVCSEKLRERFFGELDQHTDGRYEEVWQQDALSAEHRTFGVESIASVAHRARDLVLELESSYQNCVILLVAHGDVLQLLQTVFDGISPTRHRQLKPLQVAELRLLNPARG